MLGVFKIIDFSLSDIKKLRHFQVLTKIKKYLFSKTSKNKFWWLRYKKPASKDFIKTFPTCIFMNFFAMFFKKTLSKC